MSRRESSILSQEIPVKIRSHTYHWTLEIPAVRISTAGFHEEVIVQEQMEVRYPNNSKQEDEYTDRLLSTRRRKKVMVIDDDLDHRLIVAEMLVNAGYTVMTAKDGEVGLNTLIHNADKPDLIILDLMMPEKDGLAFRKEQRTVESIAHIPVVFLSGQGLVEGETCLMKPVDERIVLKTVEEAMAR